MMKVSMEELTDIKIAKSNIEKHIYDIGDYKLSKKESKFVIKALDLYLKQLELTEE